MSTLSSLPVLSHTEVRDDLERQDIHLIADLSRHLMNRTCEATTMHGYRNRKIAEICGSNGMATMQQLHSVERLLETQGTLSMNVEEYRLNDTDGESATLQIVRAATTDMWPMGTHFWVRDAAINGARHYAAASTHASYEKHGPLGKELLLSTLRVMSTNAQLARFEEIMTTDDITMREDREKWPHIFLDIATNLDGQILEKWAHKQDAWQILVFHVLDAIKQGDIDPMELTTKQKRFLGLVIPFLCTVEYYKQENSGSWEELEAIRTSVISYETQIINQLAELSAQDSFAFIADDFREFQPYFPEEYREKDFSDVVETLVLRGTEVLSSTQYESPSYDTHDPRYREADAALLYLLLNRTPQFVGKRLNKGEEWILNFEEKIVEQIRTLYDPRTGGIRRYLNDSYQRMSFFRNSTVYHLQRFYGSQSGNAGRIRSFTRRDGIVPKWPEAAWSHFVWQLSGWAGERYRETDDDQYFQLQIDQFNSGLRLITGENEVSIDVGPSGRSRIIKIPPFLIPECYITEQDADGNEIVLPSPHTPLNWAISEALYAFASMKASFEHTNK